MADGSSLYNKIYHGSFLMLAVFTPAALIMSPTPYSKPVDFMLGVLFPLHAHVGLNYVITDYVPKAARSAARVGLLGVTIVTLGGLFKLNLEGVGLTETLKSLWRKEKK